jgi:hypothetical protein
VLVDLLKSYPDLEVTALVRNPTHAETVRALGVKIVQGSFSDTDLITSHTRTADITVNSGDSDDVALNAAILAGQKARVVEDRKSPAVLLHTSGVAVFADGTTEGKHDPNGKVWNVRRIPVPYRSLDEFIFHFFFRTVMKRIFVLSLPRCCTVRLMCRKSFWDRVYDYH